MRHLSLEWNIDRGISNILGKLAKGDATPEDLALLERLQDARIALMTPARVAALSPSPPHPSNDPVP